MSARMGAARHWLACVALAAASAHAQAPATAPLGSAVERQLATEQPFSLWSRDPERVRTDGGDRLEPQQVLTESFETVKLRNVIPPIHFESGVAKIPESSVETLRKALEALRERQNVRLHLVGHADSQRLSPALARTFGDNAGLSRERAGEVAEFLKRALGLKPEGIAYEWAGDAQPVASNDTAAGRAQNRRVEVEVWYDQPKARETDAEVLVKQELRQVKVCRVETLCKLRFREGAARRSRISNLVPPLHYERDAVQVGPEFIEHIRKALDNLRDKPNLVVKFVGYADDAALSERDERIYGDLVALSKASARRVALAVQEALKLPGTAVASDGRGATAPLGPNDSAQGRAQNRRVEVQFWYDDPLRELPDEPQLCPVPEVEVVTRVYDPPWGAIAPLQLDNGRAIVPPGYVDALRRAMADLPDKAHVRLRFIGYTGNQRLDRRTAAVYGDDVGLSVARARRAMETVAAEMQLGPAQTEHEGRGYVQSPDVVDAGFTQGESSYVAVQVVYDEPAVLDDYEGVDVTPLTRELTPQSPFAGNTMHIAVDGVPIDDPGRSSSDVQRCTDVALDKADIRFRFDNLRARRRLAVAASPEVVAPQATGGASEVAASVRFRMYSNYGAFIDHAEVRIFAAGRSPQSTPLAVVPIDRDRAAEWQPTAGQLAGAGSALEYRLRAYDRDGKFDDTAPRRLTILRDGAVVPAAAAAAAVPASTGPPDDDTAAAGEADATGARAAPRGLDPDAAALLDSALALDVGAATAPALEPPAPPEASWAAAEPEFVATYGESTLARQGIPVSGGTVTVRGGGIPPAHSVWVAGQEVPVDARGNFVAEEVLPPGAHTVEVAVLDADGNGTLYLRDLEFARRDGFFVGMADLTVARNHVSQPEQLQQGANPPYDYSASVAGRLAFFATQKFADDWRVTASADTREEPVRDLFSNFLDKAPDSLFRRIDPAYYYPTFGDDSSVEELAPTLGKFYVKAQHHDDYALWGNFKLAYADNELAQVDRGLYGGNLRWQSEATTRFGERRVTVDGFAAQPGTIAGRDEFRGTGGSLYFLHYQDILTGSERARIELRDKDSGLVTGTVELRPSIDYQIDYLQGRIVLAEPLSSTASDNLLVRTSGLSGQEAYLVVRYEFTPGLQDIRTWTTGGQGDVWLNDYVRVGLTTSANDEGTSGSRLGGEELTLRKSTDTWVKLQAARSEGLSSLSQVSTDGGFAFAGGSAGAAAGANAGASAGAYRGDLSLGLADLLAGSKGRLTFYEQHLDAGYSAPGFEALGAMQYSGGTLQLPLGERWNVDAKADRKAQDGGLTTSAAEVDLVHSLTRNWSLSAGVRRDDREDHTPVVPATQRQGERTDAVAQLGYDSLAAWKAYSFVQDTVSRSGERDANGRVGVGGSYRLSDQLRLDAEASEGQLGPGGKLGTSYLVSDHTTLYLNYSLDDEHGDTGLFQRQGSLVSGVKQRLSDSSSVFVEERYQDVAAASGLTHATGVTLVPDDRWNLGASAELGTLVDASTAAETKRKAGGFHVGYGHGRVQASGGIEYRDDDIESPAATSSTLKTWLFRSDFKLQLTPDWRLVGKLDHSRSDNAQGTFYDGGFTEAVIGYGYRPVASDRLDVLAKYTYFYNMPTAGQATPQDASAQFIQKSRIASVDASYDLTPQLTLGGKYAVRAGQASLDRSTPQFFDNAAQLYIVRFDCKFLRVWEGMVEGRALRMPDLGQVRSGALIAAYRHLGKRVKAGLGYNFTRFSEDLTDLSFRSHGVFANIVGAM